MNMKKFKISINPTVILFLITAFLTGKIVEVLVMYLILIFHELGHLVVIKKYNYKINKITLLPFGAIIDCNCENKSLKEEFLLYSSGVMVNTIFLIIFVLTQNFSLIFYFNLMMLIFNLLPIHPLDGGKLLELLIASKIRYKKAITSYVITSLLLCMSLLIFFITNFINLNFIFIFSYLLMENLINIKTYKSKYNIFLLSKHLYPNCKLKEKSVEMKTHILHENLYKGKNTNVIIGQRHIKEKQILDKLYQY